jgi:hypothetical protein
MLLLLLLLLAVQGSSTASAAATAVGTAVVHRAGIPVRRCYYCSTALLQLL